MVGCCKSTVDLRLEKLIWGKTGLQKSFLLACQCSFSPITTREAKRANQKPTETGQKANPPLRPLEFEPSLELTAWRLVTPGFDIFLCALGDSVAKVLFLPAFPFLKRLPPRL